MASDMSLQQLPLTLIVAATAKNGIGKNGSLPWPLLKKDMGYFARVTKRVPIPKNTGSAQSDALKEKILSGTSQNVVIMGRKTWESIPPKFRPLKDRTNIVISSQDRSKLQPIPDEVVVASDILSGLESLTTLVKEGKSQPVGRAFIIGGSSIYETALGLPQTRRILLTRVGKEYDCDTFFPVDVGDSDFVGEEIGEGPLPQTVGDEEVSLEFQLYELA